MINQAQDTTRAEKLQISIDDNITEIENIQVIIQKLEEVKDIARFSDFNMLMGNIETLQSEITYLEELKENDEAQLNSCLNTKK